MTFEEYLVASFTAGVKWQDWRAGQCYFNTLWEHRPDLSEPIRGTALDPFYDDGKVPDFLVAVGERW